MARRASAFVGILILLGVGACASSGGGSGAGNDLNARLVHLLDRATATLGTVSGADQAVAAKRVLMDVEAELIEVAEAAAGEPSTTQRELARTAVDGLPSLEAHAKRALELPGVADVIGPTVMNLDKIVRGLIKPTP